MSLPPPPPFYKHYAVLENGPEPPLPPTTNIDDDNNNNTIVQFGEIYSTKPLPMEMNPQQTQLFSNDNGSIFSVGFFPHKQKLISLYSFIRSVGGVEEIEFVYSVSLSEHGRGLDASARIVKGERRRHGDAAGQRSTSIESVSHRAVERHHCLAFAQSNRRKEKSNRTTDDVSFHDSWLWMFR
jgi:hypothetical protein